MHVLYSRLQVNITAKLEEIQKQYRILSYKHTKSGDSQSMVNLNEAHQILIDPYKRSFYDRFGDDSLPLLTNTAWSYFVSRFFTELNVFCLNLYFILVIFNYFFLGFIYKIPVESLVFKFSPIIISPVFLLVASLNATRTIQKADPFFKKVIHALAFVSLIHNCVGIVAGGFPIWILLAYQAATIIFSQVFLLKLFDINSLKVFCLLVIKTGFLCLYYLEVASLNYFVPCLIALEFCCFDFLLGFLLSVFLFPMCLSLFLGNVCQLTIIPNIIHSVHGLIGFLILYCYCTFFTKLSAEYKVFNSQLALNGALSDKDCPENI